MTAPSDKTRKAARPPPTVPPDLAEALAASAAAKAAFEGLPPSHRREYIDWIEEAKKPETRARRVAETVRRVTEPMK
jgi:uncharacterized protein YdeI (YjbR/CyaY-like superfamily)